MAEQETLFSCVFSISLVINNAIPILIGSSILLPNNFDHVLPRQGNLALSVPCYVELTVMLPSPMVINVVIVIWT